MVLAVVHHLEIAIARLFQLNCAQGNRRSLTNRNVNKKNTKNSAELTQEGELLGVNRDQRSAATHCSHLFEHTERSHRMKKNAALKWGTDYFLTVWSGNPTSLSPRTECKQNKLKNGSDSEEKWGGEEARGGWKREMGLICFSWLPGDIDGAALTSWGPVALWQFYFQGFFLNFFSEQHRSFSFFYWWLVIYITLFRVLFPGPESHGQFLLIYIFNTLVKIIYE